MILGCGVSALLAAQQYQLQGIEEELKEKAAEKTLGDLLNDQLPLDLNADDVFPTVATLPGGPFQPIPLALTSDQLDQPLPPGDYTIPMLAFCSEYSVHQPGAGTAYVLGPLNGKAADAIGALLWRGTLQQGIAPQTLQAVSWAIQSGLTYAQMPKTYQTVIDNVIPDYKSELQSDFISNAEDSYNTLAKGTKLPPLDTLLAGMGEPGQLALSAEKQRQALLQQNTTDQIREQTLFQGQESGIYTPVKAEEGPWTERIPGVAYMRLQIVGGNMATNNVMEIRIMPQPGTTAEIPREPRLVNASFHPGQASQNSASPAPAAAQPNDWLKDILPNGLPVCTELTAAPPPAPTGLLPTLTNLVKGILGYSQGRGAQALTQIPALNKSGAPGTGAVLAGKLEGIVGKGTVTVLRNGKTMRLTTCSDIYMNDILTAGKNSRVYLRFQDNSEMTLVPGGAQFEIDNYVYCPPGTDCPGKKNEGLLMKWAEGAFVWLSGKIGRDPDADVRLETAFGCICVRGTEFITHYDDTAKTLEVDLIAGSVVIGPDSGPPIATLQAPVVFQYDGKNPKTMPLTPNQFNAMMNQLMSDQAISDSDSESPSATTPVPGAAQ